MTGLVVRRLLIDLETPFPRHWCGGDPFRSALLNALSMSFPVGEQFFIDSVRNGLAALPTDKQAQYKTEAQGFIGQEATHRRIHGLFNAHLEKQGLVNDWERRAQKRMKQLEGSDLRHNLAITAANEHFTAILAEWLLQNHDMLNGSEPRLKILWLWHSAEESEHKSIAFDLYQALDGSHEWRISWFRRVTMIFLSDTARQTVSNLRRDGTLWKWSTWKSAASYLFGRRGLLRQIYKPWRAYFQRGFHPTQLESDLARRWLADNAGEYSPVGAA
jgi:predicted metal-dependent hydrolase